MNDKLDTIYEAFADYIRQHDYFDIVHSEKVGYFKILVKELEESCPEQLNTPEKLLKVLFNEVINDVVFSDENPTQAHEEPVLTGYEEAESRRRIAAILETMTVPDRRFGLDFLDRYIAAYQRDGRS